MNLINILLIVIGIIGIGFWLFVMSGFMLAILLHHSETDPVRLKWLAIGKFMYLPFILSISAIGFSIYNWR
jgi:hypothetical protein